LKRVFPYVVLLILSISIVAEAAPKDDAAKQQANGQQVFLERCMMCHSVNKDQVMTGPSLWSEMNRSPHRKTAAQIRIILRDGKGKMPPMKTVLTPEQIDDVLAYLHSL
jgi:mono/diheme cytochrome c family protein